MPALRWYRMLTTDPPQVDPKGESCLSHLREKMLHRKHLTLGLIIGLHIQMGRNVCWNKSKTVLVSQTQYLAGQPGKKRRY